MPYTASEPKPEDGEPPESESWSEQAQGLLERAKTYAENAAELLDHIHMSHEEKKKLKEKLKELIESSENLIAPIDTYNQAVKICDAAKKIEGAYNKGIDLDPTNKAAGLKSTCDYLGDSAQKALNKYVDDTAGKVLPKTTAEKLKGYLPDVQKKLNDLGDYFNQMSKFWKDNAAQGNQ